MKKVLYLLFAIVLAIGGFAAFAKITSADGEENNVEITEKDGFRNIKANGIPNHETGIFPNRGNPNRISVQNYNFRIPLEPKKNNKPTFTQVFGVALNGVPFDPGTAELWNGDFNWRYEALTGGLNLGIDSSLAHVQPNGAYHYHGIPKGLIEKLKSDKKVVLVGYAADGFPVYSQFGYANPTDSKSVIKEIKGSYRIKQGNRPANSPGGKYDGKFVADWEYIADSGDLDECNGRFGVTPEYPIGTYHYYLTATYPFIPRCVMGIPDASFRKGPPPGGRPLFGRPSFEE